MPPRRKDAKSRATPTALRSASAPASLDARADAAVAKLKPYLQPAAWWIRRLFRLFCLVSVGLYLYPRLFPKEGKQVEVADVDTTSRFEPIVLDEQRRAAVLEAFKVSEGRALRR